MTPLPANPPDGTTTGTILIVDDTPVNLMVLLDHLEEYGYDVVVAQDAEEGIQRAELVQPDLILLDIMMPGMDGFAACHYLKSRESTRDIPVIFMTALADDDDKSRGFEAGGVDYVTKPFQIAEVLARVQTHLTLRNLQVQLDEQNALLREEMQAREQARVALKTASEQLQESEARYRLLVEQLSDAVMIVSDGQVAFTNSAAASLFGASSPEDLHGCALSRLALEETENSALLPRVHERGRHSSLHVTARRLDGKPVAVTITQTTFQYRNQPALQWVLRRATGARARRGN